MAKQNKKNLLAIFFLLIVSISIFWKFFLYGLYPFPGDFLLAWFEPWKTDFFNNGAITIAHKPIGDDVFRQIFPFKVLANEIFGQLNFPLWNPYNGSGMPLYATMHVGFLNPFNIFFFIFSHGIAWTLYIIVQVLLIALFTYLYLRKIGITLLGSIFSTLCFVFSGFVITRTIYGDYDYALSMLPLILYIFETYLQNNSRKIYLLPFAIFFMLASTQPQIVIYILCFTFLYFVYRSKTKKTPFISLLFAVGIGLSSIQLIPTLELFEQASISPSSAKFIFDRFLLPLQHLITIAIPNYFGNQSTYNYWGSGDYIETVASLSLIPCFFALLGIGKLRARIVDARKFLILAALITIALTIDWLGTRILFSLPIPIISTGIPSRIFAITTFCICVLAAYGFDKWLNIGSFKEIKKEIIRFSLLVLVFLAGTVAFYVLEISCDNEFILNCRNIALRNTILEISVFVTTMVFICLYVLNKKARKIPPFVIIFLVIAIGIYNSNKFLPFSEKETILPQNDLLKELQKIKDARVFGLGEANIKTNFATYFKFYDPNYYDPLYNRRYGEFIAFGNNTSSPDLPRSDVEITSDLTLSSETKQRRDRLFDLLSIKYLILKKSDLDNLTDKQVFWQDNNWAIVLNDKALPFSFTVSKFEIISNQKNILPRLFNSTFNPSNTVILEEKPNMLLTDQLLVSTENYYPGWKAYVDNKETKIFRANYTFRAIVLPKGKHDIKFKYQPESLKIGITISLSSLIILILLYLISRQKIYFPSSGQK